jgi:hypothetical protein
LEIKRLFEPGDGVNDPFGQAGLVLSLEVFEKVKSLYPEGKRPGRFFAPGCCSNPDFITQIPVIFEDGTYDVMRAMNLKRSPDLEPEKKEQLEQMIRFE